MIDKNGLHTQQKVAQIHQFYGLGRKRVSSVRAGDICAISGLDPIEIGDTIACADKPSRLAVIAVDEPTMTMTFRVNDGPFAGKDGQYVTGRQISERLNKELQQNVALRVAPGQTPEEFNVSGRGLMHLGFCWRRCGGKDTRSASASRTSFSESSKAGVTSRSNY